MPLSARPGLTLVLVVSPEVAGLEELVAVVLPSCREYGAELLVAGGTAGQRVAWEGEAVRFLPGGTGESDIELRSRAMGAARGNIVVFLAAAAVPSLDVSALLGHRTGIVSLELRAEGEPSAPAGRSGG